MRGLREEKNGGVHCLGANEEIENNENEVNGKLIEFFIWVKSKADDIDLIYKSVHYI